MIRKLMPLFCVGFGGYFAVMGIFKYHVWDKGPRGGFLPLVMGLFVAALSFVVFFRELKPAAAGNGEKQRSTFNFSMLIPPAVVLTAILASYLVGLLPAIGLMVFGWLVILEKVKPLKALLVSAILLVAVWLIFSMWLRVPFPTGIFKT